MHDVYVYSLKAGVDGRPTVYPIKARATDVPGVLALEDGNTVNTCVIDTPDSNLFSTWGKAKFKATH